jgi:hypothetical protein
MLPITTIGTTVVVETLLPNVWPPRRNHEVLQEYQLEDGRLLVLASRNGRVTILVLREAKKRLTTLDEKETCPIIPDTGRSLRLALTIISGKITAIACNGSMVFSRDNPENVVSEVRIQKRISDKATDFTAKNISAVERRKGRLEGYVRAGGGDVRDYVMAALEDELKQLRDLLALVNRGGQHHWPGIASRVRLLVVGHNNMGLLQFAAALKSMPLILYTWPDPSHHRGGVPLYGFNLSGSPKQTESNPNPVDLDVWLRTPALRLGETKFTVHELIKQIGNTVGSHRDLNVAKSVAAMVRRPSLAGHRYNDMGMFIGSLADIMIALSRTVLKLRFQARQTNQLILRDSRLKRRQRSCRARLRQSSLVAPF